MSRPSLGGDQTGPRSPFFRALLLEAGGPIATRVAAAAGRGRSEHGTGSNRIRDRARRPPAGSRPLAAPGIALARAEGGALEARLRWRLPQGAPAPASVASTCRIHR